MHSYVLAAMVVIGVIGLAISLRDSKASKNLVNKTVFAAPADKAAVSKALKKRDEQYVFVSLVLFVGASVVLYLERNKHKM